MSSEQANIEDIFNILVATDLHLGYNETDSIRGEDSFIAFEEILQHAIENDVDFILLGGDLFHDAKPSPNCLLKCTSLLRKYCFGNKPVSIEILSDQSENFKESTSRTVNYEDPDINISYPIFSIHGNHDDPIGRSAISSLDILSKMGLVNYIGKWTSYNEVVVSPVLMKKGVTKLALYGLSHLKDQRLSRLFADGNVKIEKVDSDDEWFNILTLHQNRVERGYMNYIPEDVLPDFMDLIVWGHEHDCHLREEWNPRKEFHVLQPGSPVATSLAAGESIQKHCFHLQVYKKSFKLIPIPLQTVRPFVFKSITLSEHNIRETVNESEVVQEFLKRRIEQILTEIEFERTGHEKQPKLPLVRLSVFYERPSQQFNVIRFGQQYSDKIANPQDLIMLKSEKLNEKKVNKKHNLDLEVLDNIVTGAEDDVSVETLLEQYYQEQPEEKQLAMLSVKCLGEAVNSFIQKGYTDSISDVIKYQKDQYLEHLMKSDASTEEDIMQQVSAYKAMHFSDSNSTALNVRKILESASQHRVATGSISDENSDVEISPVDVSPTKVDSSATTNSRGRGRGSRGGRARGGEGGRGSRGGRGGRGSRGSNKDKNTNSSSLNVSFESRSSSSRTPTTSNWLSDLSLRSSQRNIDKNSAPKTRGKAVYIDDSD